MLNISYRFAVLLLFSCLSSIASPSLQQAEKSFLAYVEDGNAAAIRHFSDIKEVSPEVFVRALNLALSKGRQNTALAVLSRAPHADIEMALLDACVHGKIRMALFLLEHEANPNAFDTLGRSALMLAAKGGHEELVKLLLTQEADTNKKCNEGLTAYDYARINKRTKVLAIKGLRGKPVAQSFWTPETTAKAVSIAVIIVPVVCIFAYQRFMAQRAGSVQIGPGAATAAVVEVAAESKEPVLENAIKALCAACNQAARSGKRLSILSCEHSAHTACIRSIIANAIPQEYREAALGAMNEHLKDSRVGHSVNTLVSAAINGLGAALANNPQIQDALISTTYNIVTLFMTKLKCPTCNLRFGTGLA